MKDRGFGIYSSIMTITTILFDFGGVLWVPLDEPKFRKKRDSLAIKLGFQDGETMWQYFYGGEEWERTKTGRWRKDQMWTALLSPLHLVTRESQDAFLEELLGGLGIKPEMEQILEQLVKTHRLAILSNASDDLEWLVNEDLGIGHYFSEIINSHRIGVAKPALETYQMALERLKVRPGELYFIDDQERNTRAAVSLGIRSHVFTTVDRFKQELVEIGILN